MTMPAVIDRQKGGDTLFVRMLGAFALLALTLAAIGIYGLVAYSVGQRTHEIGIRMALGAKSPDVLRMVLWEGMKMSAIGVLIGLALALPLPQIFDAMFYGMRLREPRIYFIVPMADFRLVSPLTASPRCVIPSAARNLLFQACFKENELETHSRMVLANRWAVQ